MLGFCNSGVRIACRSVVVQSSVSTSMNSHALNVIEFPRTLALISERATAPLGAERVRELRPSTDRESIEKELARGAGGRSPLSAEGPWHLDGVPDARAPLTRLRVEGASLAAS